MGPNSFRLLDELTERSPKDVKYRRTLDLGCGFALTSLFIANETNAENVFALDLWVEASENYKRIKENHLDYCVVITVLISAFVGAWIAVRKAKQNSLLICTMAGASYYVLLLMINISFYEGQFAGMLETGLLALGGSMCVFLCGFRGKRKPNSHKRVRYSG